MKGSPTWLKRTGQTWKILVFGVLILVGMVLFGFFVAVVNGKVEDGDIMYSAFAFMGAAFAAFVWLTFAIRCPECGAKPAWHFMRTARHQTWFQELLRMEDCPSCRR